MDVEAKKRKVHSECMEIDGKEKLPVTPERTVLLNMDNDCIESICDWLSLNDLCSFSLTCKRIYKLANQYFYRQYKNHRMEIVNELSGPRINTKECYAKCFRANVRNIRITSVYWNVKPIHLFTFLRMNCCENLQELELDTINLKSGQPYGEQMLTQLEHLTTISFINCSVYDIYNGFLRYCNGLKRLVVKEEKSIRMNCTWMFHVYPHLESLIYYVPECYNVPPLTEFFRLNPRVKRVACSGDRMLNIIANTSITLDYLTLRIEHAILFNATFSVLKMMCEQKRVHRLKLEFGWYVIFSAEMANSVADLATFTALDGLSFATKELQLTSYHPIIRRQFNGVKSLRLEVSQPITEQIFHRITFTVPNVEEIHLHPWWHQFIVNFRICIGILAAQLKQLKIIVIHRIDADIISVNSIVQMDIWRKQLSDACPLSIYLPHEIIQNIKFIIPVGSIVTVKPISSLERDIYSSERRAI